MRTNTSIAGPRTPPRLRVHDGLEIQFELVVGRAPWQLLQPVNLAAVAGRSLLRARIHMDVQAALFLAT